MQAESILIQKSTSILQPTMPSFGRNRVEFELNGESISVENPDPIASLGEFLRDDRGLLGLKLSCKQGGCGSCTVLLSDFEPTENKTSSLSSIHKPVNSCLVPLCSVDGKKVTTVEGIGSVKKGLHPVQTAIVEHHGTQCGYCTPGMVKTSRLYYIPFNLLCDFLIFFFSLLVSVSVCKK